MNILAVTLTVLSNAAISERKKSRALSCVCLLAMLQQTQSSVLSMELKRQSQNNLKLLRKVCTDSLISYHPLFLCDVYTR